MLGGRHVGITGTAIAVGLAIALAGCQLGAPTSPKAKPRADTGVVSNNAGGNVVANNGGAVNAPAAPGAAIVSGNAANAVPTIVAQGGGNMVSQGGGNMAAQPADPDAAQMAPGVDAKVIEGGTSAGLVTSDEQAPGGVHASQPASGAATPAAPTPVTSSAPQAAASACATCAATPAAAPAASGTP